MEKLIDQMNKASNPVKFGGLAAVVVLLTAATFFLLVQPIEEKIDQQKAQQTQLERSLAEKQEIAQNLNEKRRQMDELEQQLQDALTELPEKKDIDELLATLNDIGKKSGLEIARVEPGAEAAAAFFAKIPVKMNVAGNYHEIAMFLQEIASMRRIVNVTNIKMGGGTMRGDKVILSADFMATTFRFLDPSKAPKSKDKKKGAP
jgi:type IV pilus assembly protein PilO